MSQTQKPVIEQVRDMPMGSYLVLITSVAFLFIPCAMISVGILSSLGDQGIMILTAISIVGFLALYAVDFYLSRQHTRLKAERDRILQEIAQAEHDYRIAYRIAMALDRDSV